MKKIYIIPKLDVVKIETVELICNSPETPFVPGEGQDDQWSNKYQGPAGGLLWEDDNNGNNE